MRLITKRPGHHHVSQDTVDELEAAILRDVRVAAASSHAISGVVSFATRAANRLGVDPGSVLGASKRTTGDNDYFAVMMDLDVSRIAPWFMRSGRKSVYMFDAWPSKHRQIIDLVESWGVQYAFVSSSQAAERLANISDRCTFIWVPEGIDPTRYQSRSPLERDIDVLQLGRKHDSYHAIIEPALRREGRSYLYERSKGTIVFPTRGEFVDGLARSKISVCVPSSVTHPERAADIETMTIRYLQSMVSKCIVVGHAPSEMIELFGYNPVVEIDPVSPDEQIIEILDRYEDWMPLIEKNFETVRSAHTWDHRWQRMAAVLFPS
jgi:hypothetical protein